MGLAVKKEKVQRSAQAASSPLNKGLYLAVSSAADISDPAARQATVLQRIKETTAFHWGMGVPDRSTQALTLGQFKPVCHRTTVWFAY